VAKFQTEVERAVTVRASRKRAYQYLRDVAGSAVCIEGLDHCVAVGDDTYEFVYEERSAGPMSLCVRYTARYEGNGKDRISYEGVGADRDNADIRGELELTSEGRGVCRITLRQMVAPETPIPRLVQGMIRSFVEKEAAAGVEKYLDNVKAELEKSS